ncbi:MAG: CHAT domain-containing tetratricopeptide repeat protein [Pseudomonadota bacterium]
MGVNWWACVALCSAVAWPADTSAAEPPATLDEAREFHRAGDLEKALWAYRDVTLNSTASRDVATAHNNACVILMNQGNYRGALEQCGEARRLRTQSGDDRRLARTLNNLGTVLEALGHYDDAEAVYVEALQINRDSGDLASQAINLSNLGVLAMSIGDFSGALQYLDIVQSLAQDNIDEWWAPEQRVLAVINRGVALEKLGSYREALAQYVDALETGGEALDPARMLTLQVNIGVAYRNLGDPVRALESFRASVADAGDDKGTLANAWLNIGIVQHLNLADTTAAESAYRTSLDLAASSGDHAGEIQSLSFLGRLLLEQGRQLEARQSFETAMERANESGYAEGRWAALDGLARVHAAQDNFAEALVFANEAITQFEAVRAELGQQSLRQNYLGEKRSVYSLAVAIHWALAQEHPNAGHAAEAFHTVQKAKARELLDAMGSSASIPRPLDVDDIRSALQDTLVLEYYMAEQRLFMWAVSSETLAMFDLGDHTTLQEAVSATHRSLVARSAPDPETIETLSATLLGPAGATLARSRELRVSPDGRLHYLPFELLSVPDTAQTLGDSHVLTYLPSASAGHRLRPALPHSVLLSGFADAQLEHADAGYERGALIQRFALEPLPQAREELRKLNAALPGTHTVRFGAAASEEAFRESATRGARVVHIAGHTIVDERFGRQPAIVLSPDAEHDGLLYPSEIAALDYRATLTVLAACRTALGSAAEGRAISSLTGSLLAAGSSAVVATLWDVDDGAAAVFMEQFYAQLARGLDPARALQATKQTFRSDPRWSNAADWAGYVLIGNAPPIIERGFRFGWLVASGLLFVLFAFIRIRARRSQS